MLVTISGIDGSGKSTVASHAAQILKTGGIDSRYVRFRRAVFGGLQWPWETSRSSAPGDGLATTTRRWTGFRPRTLTAGIACGYVARIAAFRLFGPRLRTSRCHVFDRYFYDSFMHYELRTGREQLYCAIIRRLIPVPDLAVLLLALPETIGQRRPNVASEFIRLGAQRYGELQRCFPELVTIRTDPGERALERVELLVRERLVWHRAAKKDRHGSR